MSPNKWSEGGLFILKLECGWMTEYATVTRIDRAFYSMLDQRSVRRERSFPTTDQEVRIALGQCRLTRD